MMRGRRVAQPLIGRVVAAAEQGERQQQTALTQAAMAVARAMPTWPNHRLSSERCADIDDDASDREHHRLAVSSRAKKPGENTLFMTKAGSPRAKAASA